MWSGYLKSGRFSTCLASIIWNSFSPFSELAWPTLLLTCSTGVYRVVDICAEWPRSWSSSRLSSPSCSIVVIRTLTRGLARHIEAFKCKCLLKIMGHRWSGRVSHQQLFPAQPINANLGYVSVWRSCQELTVSSGLSSPGWRRLTELMTRESQWYLSGCT